MIIAKGAAIIPRSCLIDVATDGFDLVPACGIGWQHGADGGDHLVDLGKLNQKEALNEKERKRLETYSRRLTSKEQELSDALIATEEERKQYEQRMFDRLLKRDPSAAKQVEAAKEAQIAVESATEAAKRKMVGDVAKADERVSAALSDRLATVRNQERQAKRDAAQASEMRFEAQRLVQAAQQDRADAAALLKANEATLEQAQGWKMLHSVEKKKVAQLEIEVSQLKTQLELIKEATHKVLSRLLPNWGQVGQASPKPRPKETSSAAI
ncbi:hypothetical protein, partial [Epibacterium ulvae]|uniref:hypothetical protein n=1 Tax=Epibacterium ulvae TaxID=1156985 RepID=UPI0012FEE2EB